MTLVEKLGLIALAGRRGIENIDIGVPSLCIPALTLSDGPNGISNHTPSSIQLPASIGVAASFDTAVARRYGEVEGEEARAKGIDVLQSPELNLARVPESGRIFEAYGEDPVLTAAMGVAEIEGIQSEGVLSDAKHFTAYNQETSRPRLDEVVSERVLQELYDLPFKAAVEQGHVASIMCAYGSIDGVNDCSDPVLFKDLDSWGFDGFVRSDLESVRRPATALAAGTDLLKPATVPELEDLVASGQLRVAAVDRAVEAVLAEMLAFGLVAHPRPLRPAASAITPGRLSVARWAAERSMVLLVDRHGLLPLSRRLASVAVIGFDATTSPMSAGFGSARVISSEVQSPLAGLEAALPRTRFVTAAGGVPNGAVVPLRPDDLAGGASPDGHGDHHEHSRRPIEPGKGDLGIVTAANASRDVLTAEAPGVGADWKRWSAVLDVGHSGLYELSLRQYGDTWCDLDGRRVLSMAGLHGPGIWTTAVPLLAGRRYELSLAWYAIARAAPPLIGLEDVSPLIDQAVEAARSAKVAVVFVSDYTKEGMDRPSLYLPGDADALISAVAAANPDTVVVLNTGGAVLMPWLGKVKAVLEAWYPGQEDGEATAAVLTGAVDPSGRLPLTFPASEGETPVSLPSRYPGIDGTVTYGEGLDIGYRWYLAEHRRPLFPFGYGTSYTSFRITQPSLRLRQNEVVAKVRVRNTGRREGTEVVEAYVAYPPSAGEPPEQLRAFVPVTLRPGTEQQVRLTLPRSAFEAYLSGRWRTVRGPYHVSIGTDAEDLPIRLATAAP